MPIVTKHERAAAAPLKSHEEMFGAFARAAADLINYADIDPLVGAKIELAVEALLDSSVRGLYHGEYMEISLAYAGRLLDERERLEERLERELADDDCRSCA